MIIIDHLKYFEDNNLKKLNILLLGNELQNNINLSDDNIFERKVDSYYFSSHNSIGYKIEILLKLKQDYTIIKEAMGLKGIRIFIDFTVLRGKIIPVPKLFEIRFEKINSDNTVFKTEHLASLFYKELVDYYSELNKVATEYLNDQIAILKPNIKKVTKTKRNVGGK